MTTLADATTLYLIDCHNDGVERARADYERFPNTACYYSDCDILAADGYMCRYHKGWNSRRRAAS